MKRTITFILIALLSLVGLLANAQTRTKVGDGVYLVRYGNNAILEDDKNQRSVSIEISQEIKDRQTNEKIYKVACGKWTKRVVKDALRLAIVEGIKSAGVSGGTSLIVSAASTAAFYIYDDVCEYYGERK